ncbi:amidohydrolase family protein [Advenella mimigardefordensis]|uniref:Putative amidohydrolase 2 n=1 Tax=Advenella mimigardefordensis (strain DSM 17166 / LMG 22922 / DPN7) TaxID=1247726 RepID=W0PBL0_ADVMD|nr:amidohydrolase family protein [Advenella mimigardefordensis]AHG64131.1 putative amidohydrolase 2 [Advenella mimigardefordensis DPN7]
MNASSSLFSATRAPNLEWLGRAVPETAIDPHIPIVDAHMHLWDHKTGYRYFLPEFADDAAQSNHRIDATVYVECHSMYRADGPDHLKCIGETEFAVGMAAQANSRKYTDCRVADVIVGYADLTLGSRAGEALEAHMEAANGRFRGIRQRAKWDPDPAVRGAVHAGRSDLFADKHFRQGLDVLTTMGLSFDASVFHPQLMDLAKLAQAHPDSRIVVIHCGSPVGHASYRGREEEVYADWMKGMKALAACPNVSIKLGGLLMCLGSYDFTAVPSPLNSEQLAQLWRPYLEPCVELFGAQRCMVSSNFPVDKAGVPYGTVWNMFKRVMAGCSVDEKNWIFNGTARQFYRMT